MKLENKFFNSFFFPFIISIISSTLVVTIILSIFSNNNNDSRTNGNIINITKKYSKTILKSVNVLLTNKLIKYQSSLNELIIFYQKMANELLKSNSNLTLNNEFLKCLLTIDEDFCDDNIEEASRSAFWLVDGKIDEEKLDEQKDIKKQLIAYSYIINNIDAVFESTKPNAISYYFYFEETELYIHYPIIEKCEFYLLYFMREPLYDDYPCFDDNGEYHTVYKPKCENVYKNMMKSKTGAYDNNYISNQNRTIFITSFYDAIEYNFDIDIDKEFTMCIGFDDPITLGKGYACADVSYTDMILPLENLNSKIVGYFFITNVGYNNLFYYPQKRGTPKSSTEEIFKWDMNYKLAEKTYFHDHIRKIFSSNYIDYIGQRPNDEVFINGMNSTNQFLYIDLEEYKYSIYPLVLENLNGKREHIFSIVYIYSNKLYLNELEQYSSSLIIKIILELLLFIIFGSGLLYIIHLTFNTLVKHIVISIKNVIYMLKGINIGGENRLDFLKFLKKRRDDNIEKLENAYLYEQLKNKKEFEQFQDTDIGDDSDNEYLGKNNIINESNANQKESNNNKINTYSDLNKKYDEESDYIEKEINFYDFDEQLLQYRPLEIENLMKSIMNIKKALILTSSDNEVKKIINYSNSENIFSNFKNKKGSIICQSNIGNLQSQLLKYDKAIYHLVLSLQDNNIKKFISKNLTDELDEDNSLLKKISNLYNKEKQKEKNNILSNKQMHNSKNNFSQNLIGILINTRYCRLIHSYYQFFKNMKKLRKSIHDNFSEQLMNTKFHTINYYHKIIIQFIYLSYVKNDLVKIGESILDYLEFLIKFKFKTSKEDKNFLSIKYSNIQEYKIKRDKKKKIFDKIINWFNVFDDYISYVKDNSSLVDSKCIIDDYSHSLNNENFEFNLESQTAFSFRINIQKSNFLKGKFCLHCKNYIDALYYFIRSSKNESIVTDGLIKKRSLKHIYKILIKMNKKYEKLGLKNLNMNKELKEYKRDKAKNYNTKYRIGRKRTIRMDDSQNVNNTTFGDELKTIKNDISNNINECYAKREKNIIILIDFNIYNKKELNSKTSKIDSFIEEAITILKNYLSTNDKLGILIYYNDYKIICPLMPVNKIDIKNCSTDLYYCKNREISTKENNIDSIESKYNEIEILHLDGNNNSEHLAEESLELSENEEINYDKINGLVKAINYLNNYSTIKEGIKVDKYIILFTDVLNVKFFDVEEVEKIFEKIIDDKYSIFLLVGKNKTDEKNNINDNNNYLEELILSKFGEKSEAINFENMKKIKTILSNNKVIKDEIFYPNEIYK